VGPAFVERVRAALYWVLCIGVILTLLLSVGTLATMVEMLASPFHAVWGGFLAAVAAVLLVVESLRMRRVIARWRQEDTYLLEVRDGSSIFGAVFGAALLVGSVLYAILGNIWWVIGSLLFAIGVVRVSLIVATRYLGSRHSE
jgi:hypothetical protein